jgi:hypothetical protein
MNRMKKCSVCCGIFLVCFIARIIEYFFIRTDETVLAENFIHKVFGIVVLFIILHVTKSKWRDIGFVKNDFAGNIVKGLLLGAICFAVAYAIECIILYKINGNVNLCLLHFCLEFGIGLCRSEIILRVILQLKIFW